MRIVTFTIITLALMVLFPQQALSATPCTVSVTWESIAYLTGDVGNDWTFKAKVDGQVRVVRADLDPGATMGVNEVFTDFDNGTVTTPELPDTVFIVTAEAIERDILIPDIDINVKTFGPTVCERHIPFFIELAVQELPKHGHATLRFGFTVRMQ